MADIRPVTPTFAVAPQLTIEDMIAVAAAGYKTVIANRPDGETSDQPSLAAARAAAEAAGLAFIAIPFTGSPQMTEVDETVRALDSAAAPVLAYCRSGTRSVTAWALAQASAGKRQPEEIIGLARSAGYDLGPLRPVLTQLAAR